MKSSIILATLTFVAFVGSGLAAEPTVQCPVPVSPVNGQVSLMKNGDVVKYVCNNGFQLLGSDVVHCKDGTWSSEPPTCIEEDDALPDGITTANSPTQAPTTTQRPLFKWDDENKNENLKTVTQADSDEEMLNDEARLHLLLYPKRRRVVARVHQVPADAKSDDKAEAKSEAPSVIYVKRGKPKVMVYRRAGLHDSNEVAYVGEKENGEVAQNDERWRYLHWLHQAGYHYPSSHAYSLNGHPMVMTLSESQLAWINSLYPEVRDKYLKDLYSTRSQYLYNYGDAYGNYGDAYGNYGDAYRYWYYNHPYYNRQPVSVAEDPIANFDYTCHQVDDSGRASLIRAPQLSNAHVYRYDRRQNPRYPNNHYLTVEYRCNPGYALLDTRVNEMFCSKKGWVGNVPACVPRA